ncbi:MAG: hypothetical protein GY847_39060 [Proteobacteria bacterium]|nr:hypothetical protein [Pseudomonadota bacterium]
MKNFKAGSFEMVLTSGTTNHLSWIGQIDSGEISKRIGDHLGKLIAILGGKKLEISFVSLEYVNSSAIQPIITFIRNLNTNEIETEIVYSKEIDWQVTAFKALIKISSALKYITIVGQ